MNIKKIIPNLPNENLSNEDAAEIIISLLEKSDDEKFRILCINTLMELNLKYEKLIKIFEECAISDSNLKVREVAIYALAKICWKKPPKRLFEWIIERENSILILKAVINSLIDKDKNLSSHLEKKLVLRYSKLFNIIPEEAKFFWDLEVKLCNEQENITIGKSLIELPYTSRILSNIPKNFLSNSYKPSYTTKHKRVHFLNLSGLGLEFIPESICLLLNLKYLNLSFNKLKNLLDSINSLSNLKYLNLSNNKLKEIPDSIKSLSKLRYLNISFNPLRKISKHLLRLVKDKISKRYIWFGVVPSEALVLGLLEILSGYKLTPLSKDKEFNFNQEFFNSFKLNEQGHVTGLSIYDNKLNMPLISVIPKQICDLKHLEILIIPIDKTEVIPDCVRKLTYFEELEHRYINR
ncbi:MAG: leucine-rich repeat domain-containing protein [Candidatus Thorarchaeota archaeon]